MAKKKFDYFNYFKDVSDIICEAADYLYATFSNFDPGKLREELDLMHEIEHKADCAKHQMMKLLAHEFITPIEREDIVALAQCLDTVVDSMEDVLLRIYMFNVTVLREDAVGCAKIITKCAKELDKVIAEFKNFKNSNSIREAIVVVNNYESEGDRILVEGVHAIAASSASDRELFAWTDIYEQLELCLDACEDVTDIIESVIMKNT